MAAVNRNMFDASITTDRPGGVSLMKLPLNLIVQIVSNVSLSPPLSEKATHRYPSWSHKWKD